MTTSKKQNVVKKTLPQKLEELKNNLYGFVPSAPKCIPFLLERLSREDYRGIQIGQHNRYTIDDMTNILNIMYSKAGTNSIQIRTTDLSKRPENIPEEKLYAEITREIKQINGKTTQDSLRKNLFVDMHRMGLIDRYDVNGIVANPYSQKRIKYVSITQEAISLLQESNVFAKQMCFSKAINKLTKGYDQTIFSLMCDLDTDFITLDEMMLFVSWIEHTTADEIAELIKEFRLLPAAPRRAILSAIKNYASPKDFKGDKKDKKDWGNWRNESQQIAKCYLDVTAFFEFDKSLDRVILKTTTKSVGLDMQTVLKRSSQVKNEYFSQHAIGKKSGFELHHIVPLCSARDANMYNYLDDWKNLVYIDGFSHNKITQNGNRNIVLSFENFNMLFSTCLNDNTIICKDEENVIYQHEKKTIMLKFNKDVLESTNIIK